MHHPVRVFLQYIILFINWLLDFIASAKKVSTLDSTVGNNIHSNEIAPIVTIYYS